MRNQTNFVALLTIVILASTRTASAESTQIGALSAVVDSATPTNIEVHVSVTDPAGNSLPSFDAFGRIAPRRPLTLPLAKFKIAAFVCTSFPAAHQFSCAWLNFKVTSVDIEGAGSTDGFAHVYRVDAAVDTITQNLPIDAADLADRTKSHNFLVGAAIYPGPLSTVVGSPPPAPLAQQQVVVNLPPH